MRRPLVLPLAAVGILIALGLVVVWQRAALVHLGSEVASLRAREARLEEERQALRMGLSSLGAPEQLVLGQPKDAWSVQDRKTQEVIQRVQDSRQPPVLRADARP